MTAILRTPAGEPVVVYMLVFSDGRSAYAGALEDDALDFMDAFPGSRIERCHLLPLPEDARTVQREGGADE